MSQPTILLLDIGNVVVFAAHTLSFDYLEGQGVPRHIAVEMYTGNTDYLEFSLGIIDEVEFTESLNWRFGTALSVAEMRQVHDIHIYEVNDQLLAAVRKFNPAEVAIVTDTNPWQTKRERELTGPSTYAAAGEFRSHEMRMLKSDPLFFKRVLETLQVPAGHCLLIDDSPTKIETAASCGIRTHLFENTEATIAELERLRVNE